MMLRIRLAIFLISLAAMGLELALMRVLSLHFWHHFAAMVISVALLGLGFSGTVLTLVQTRLLPARKSWLWALALAASLSMLVFTRMVQGLGLDLPSLPWRLWSQWPRILVIQGMILVPFFFCGGFLGLALMDRPPRLGGHYAASLTGSGAGALGALGLMEMLSTPELVVFLSFLAFAAGVVLMEKKNPKKIGAAIVLGGVWAGLALGFPDEIRISPYKKLSLLLSRPKTRVIHRAEGPLGRLDVVTGPAIHEAPPGMSLNNPHLIPERTLVIRDGDRTRVVYDAQSMADYKFLAYTTGALAHVLKPGGRVLVTEPGGGAPLALALLYQSREITVLAPDRAMKDLIQGQLAQKGGKVFNDPRAHVHFETPRGYFQRPDAFFDLIILPMLDPISPGGTGLTAGQADYGLTVESFRLFLRHLTDAGVVCVTVGASTPPKDGLRLFNTAVEALRQEGLGPENRLALVRSWETVTLAMQKSPWTRAQLSDIRRFCLSRGFDLCYLPGLALKEANRFHLLERPDYFRGALALLGPGRQSFVDAYLFFLDPPTDDRPFFHHFLGWQNLAEAKRRLKGGFPAFLEPDYLLAISALLQAIVFAGLLVFVPLLPRIRGIRASPAKGWVLAYFSLLGAGFMLLEMSFLQKLILYLAHPIYSSGAVMASFLVFAGLGSLMSARWNAGSGFAGPGAAMGVGVLSLVWLFGMDFWLAFFQGLELMPRFFITALFIAPLAIAMGHLFPMGLARVAAVAPELTPWAWAVNGFFSVAAAAGAFVLAMAWGFSSLILMASACYFLAGAVFCRLPAPRDRALS